MTRVLVIENEKDQADRLISMLEELFPEMEILDVCQTVESSLDAIKKYLPGLVFMDVQLNDGEVGFEIIERLKKIDFELVVTTSFNKYAKQACKASALDFLEKPFPKEELVEAVEKFKRRRNQAIDPRQVELLLSVYENPTLPLKKFPLPTMEGLIFVETNSITYFKASDNQSFVYFTDGRKECINKKLKECDQLLSHSNFFRIHRSYLINLDQVEKYIKGRDGTVLLKGSIELPVSREYKVKFLSRIKAR